MVGVDRGQDCSGTEGQQRRDSVSDGTKNGEWMVAV